MRTTQCMHARFDVLSYNVMTKTVQCRDCRVIFGAPLWAVSEEQPVRLPISPKTWLGSDWYHRHKDQVQALDIEDLLRRNALLELRDGKLVEVQYDVQAGG